MNEIRVVNDVVVCLIQNWPMHVGLTAIRKTCSLWLDKCHGFRITNNICFEFGLVVRGFYYEFLLLVYL